MIHGGLQIPIAGWLTDERIEPGVAAAGKVDIVTPCFLDELETILDAALVAGEQETTLGGLVDGKFGPVWDAITHYPSVQSFVRAVAGVCLANVRGQGTDVTLPGSELEVVCGICFAGWVLIWEFDNRCACVRTCQSCLFSKEHQSRFLPLIHRPINLAPH